MVTFYPVFSNIPRGRSIQPQHCFQTLPRAAVNCRVSLPNRSEHLRVALVRGEPRADIRARPAKPPLRATLDGDGRHTGRGLGPQYTQLLV